MTRSTRHAAIVLFLSGCRPAAPVSAAEVGAARVDFEHLGGVVGEWSCPVAEAKSVHLAYRLIASGSALVETFTTPSGKETMTVFHVDGPHVLATHYCAQGNQPRLRLERSSTSTFDFRFQDATNLTDAGASHLERLDLALVDRDHYARSETYVENGKDETTRFVCERVR